jgi:hypothetical protein
VVGLQRSVAKQKSFLRLLQEKEDVKLDDICQELLSSSRTGCTCRGLANGNVKRICPDSSCMWCDEDLERCGIKSHSKELGPNGIPPHYIVGTTLAFEYTTGEIVEVAKSSCDLEGDSCSECVAFVSGEECTSCTMCVDGYSYAVDCENLASNSSFSECSVDGPEYGIFQGLGFFVCQYIEPSNDACSNATPLAFGAAVIGRTNGATEDSISSSCRLNDGKDVWYSVKGTGGTILATTCSLETLLGTTIDVFSSGPDSCENLECLAVTKSWCLTGINGGTVSWPSEAGMLYHLRVATEECEDLFEIVVWDVPSVENTACTKVSYRLQSIRWVLL